LNGNLVQLAGANPTAATTSGTHTATPQAAVTSPNATSVTAAVPQAMGVTGGNIVMVSEGYEVNQILFESVTEGCVCLHRVICSLQPLCLDLKTVFLFIMYHSLPPVFPYLKKKAHSKPYKPNIILNKLM
jgi:hypothetical protein